MPSTQGCSPRYSSIDYEYSSFLLRRGSSTWVRPPRHNINFATVVNYVTQWRMLWFWQCNILGNANTIMFVALHEKSRLDCQLECAQETSTADTQNNDIILCFSTVHDLHRFASGGFCNTNWLSSISWISKGFSWKGFQGTVPRRKLDPGRHGFWPFTLLGYLRDWSLILYMPSHGLQIVMIAFHDRGKNILVMYLDIRTSNMWHPFLYLEAQEKTQIKSSLYFLRAKSKEH